MGVKQDLLEIEDWKLGTHSVALQLRHRTLNFRWVQGTVYGPVDHDLSQDFLAELKDICNWFDLPVVLGGDYNLIRESKDKNNGNIDMKLIDLFNHFIGDCNLKEIKKNNAKFTWTNKQEVPIMVNLDRVLITVSWESKFPLSHAWCLTRVGSDHNPVIFYSGEEMPKRQSFFYFEQQWLLEEGFRDLIAKAWEMVRQKFKNGCYSMEKWHTCITRTRQIMRGWDLQRKGEQNRCKDELLEQLQCIDNMAEMRELNCDEWRNRYEVERKLEQIYIREEIFWRERGNNKWILKGDSNTKFFQLIANGRRRKSYIKELMEGENIISEQKDLEAHIIKFYKNLFGSSQDMGVHLGNNF